MTSKKPVTKKKKAKKKTNRKGGLTKHGKTPKPAPMVIPELVDESDRELDEFLDGRVNNGGHTKWIPSPKDIENIQSLSGYGLAMDKIAHICGISERTLERHAKTDKRINVALLKGRALAEAQVSQSLFENALENTSDRIFWLKCRAGWKETNVIEHQGKDGGAIVLEAKNELREMMNDPEKRKALEKLMDD